MSNLGEVIIQAENVCKEYKLFHRSYHRILDFMGLIKPHMYDVHEALHNVNLTIRRGEKIAFIGRNGAGKSTLLKLFTGVTKPSSGTLDIRGKSHALLQIGTGFHPDFTGRQNVEAYLGNLGIFGEEAQQHIEEIITWTELEEYIDQPLKSYSTGMAMRIMFAASTVMKPEVLVVDEVLGVGDAYFQNKSFERIKELCSEYGTTLLLVTHDIYSATRLCERLVWIDRGRIIMDGDPKAAMEAYEASLRLQEEDRLRRHAIAMREKRHKEENRVLYVQLVPKDRRTIHPGLDVAALSLRVNDKNMSIDLSAHEFPSSHGLILDENEGNWGEPYEFEGDFVRPFLPYGSTKHRAPCYFTLPKSCLEATLEIDAICKGDVPYYVEIYSQDCETISLPLVLQGQTRQKLQLPVTLSPCKGRSSRAAVFGLDSHEVFSLNASRLGNKKLTVKAVHLYNANEEECYIFEHKSSMYIDVHIEINDTTFNDNIEIVLGIFKDEMQPVTRFVYEYDVISFAQGKICVVRLYLDKLLLCDGDYSMNVHIFSRKYYSKSLCTHSAVSDDVFDMARNVSFFKVQKTNTHLINTIFEHPFQCVNSIK